MQNQQQWRGPEPGPYGPPYGYPQQQNARFAGPGGPHGFPGTPGAVPGYGMPYGGPPPPPGWYPPPGQGFPQGGPPPPGPFSPPQTQPLPHGGPSPLNQRDQAPSQDKGQALPGQQQTQPGPAAGLAPPPPNQTKPTELSATPALPNTEIKPQPPNGSKPTAAAVAANQETKGAPKAATTTWANRVAVPLAQKSNVQGQAKSAAPPASESSATATAAKEHQDATQAAAAAVAAAMAKLGPVPGKQAMQAGSNDAVDNLTKKVGEMRTGEHIRHSRQPGTGGFAAGHRGGRGGRRPSNRAPVEVPTTDFDFESSNAKFNKQDLVKEAIASGSPLGTPHGDGENEKELGTNDTATNGAAAHSEDVVIPANTSKPYNKSTSFFDNLSSELKDRQASQEEGRNIGREFRTEERKRNMETFGQGSVDSSGIRGGRGGRGRGGFAGRGRGGRGRGDSSFRGGARTAAPAAEV